MQTTRTLILITTLYGIAWSEVLNCDGSTLICAGKSINCTANELCTITCTVSDCIGTTINCPTNGDCVIQCAADDDGCQVSSIIATNSLSLSINSQNVRRAFQTVSIYCPFNGNCVLSGSGQRAFQNIQIHAIFGFVFSTVSISCTGAQCDDQITMNCGNNYLYTCTVDTSTGNSCNNGPLICDTIFTRISTTWNDDYVINPAPGWIVTDYNNKSINTTFTGTLNTYHGPYYGNSNSGDLDTFSLIQHFYCAATSYVYVEYIYGFSCQEAADWSRLYLNDQMYADKHAQVDSGGEFLDNALEAEVHGQCPDKWNWKQLNGSLGEIQANTLFKVEIKVALNLQFEASVVSDLQIECMPPTNLPTAAPSTAQPTIVMDPTAAPSTANPTAIPTTIAPTTSPVTRQPTTSPVPTSGPTMQPSISPTEPTQAPNPGKGPKNAAFSLRPTQKLQTLSSTNVDRQALFVAVGIIGGLFVITVTIACKVWRKHEINHRPLYDARTQEMMRVSMVSNVELNENENEVETGTGTRKGVKGRTDVLELGTIDTIHAIDTADVKYIKSQLQIGNMT